MNRRFYALLFTFFSGYILMGQSISKLEAALKQSTSATNRITLQTQLAERYITKDAILAARYAADAYETARELKDRGLLGQIAFLQGKIHVRRSDYEKALNRFSTALRHAKVATDKDLGLKTVNQLIEIAQLKGDYKLAFEYSQERLGFVDKYSDQPDHSTESERLWITQKVRLQDEQRQLKKELEMVRSDLQQEKYRNGIVMMAGLFLCILLLVLAVIIRWWSKRKTDQIIDTKNKIIEAERTRSENLLLSIMPGPTAQEMKERGQTSAKRYNYATVLIADFKNFTGIAKQLNPQQLVNELDYCFRGFDHIISNYEDIVKIGTSGDTYICASGLTARETLPNNLVKAAMEIQGFLNEYKKEKIARDEPWFEARIGIHTGPVIAGVVGLNRMSYDIWGETVNIAARLEASCEEGKINISEATYRLVRYNFTCEPRAQKIDEVNEELNMYYVNEKSLK